MADTAAKDVPIPPGVDHVLLDLDDTLYQCHAFPSGMLTNIMQYMRDHLDFSSEEVGKHAERLYAEHGTTLAGLAAEGHRIDFEHWHDNVHGPLPYHHLEPDPALRELLLSIPVKKYVFTNADAPHMMRCLDRLGITDVFSGFITFETLNPHPTSDHGVLCKPAPAAFERAMEIALQHSRSEGDLHPGRFLFIDDSRRNVKASAAMGIHTVFVGQHDAVMEHEVPPHAVVRTLHDLPHALSTPNLARLDV